MGRRTRELIALAEAPPGSAALGREQATALLRAVGADAVPQVVERLADARVKWPWAKLRSLCETRPAEADAALDGLNSRWPAVRCHALLILEGVRLSRARRERFTAGLTRLCHEDPDATVREVAAGVARRTGR